MVFLKYVWGCTNEIHQVLPLAGVPQAHPTQTNGGIFIITK